MAHFKISYSGNLRTKALHLKSSSEIITDAPVDNHGKGEAFSPTDLVAASLCSCMFTVMGIKAESEQIDISGLTATVEKVMAAAPRRISEIHIAISWENPNASDDQKELLKKVALTCPVAKSLHPDINQKITFDF